MTFLERLTLLEISEIDKFKVFKGLYSSFSISLSLFPEPIYNNVNYQAHTKGIAPHVLYIHCHAHCLNPVNTIINKPEIVDMFSILQAIYVFL